MKERWYNVIRITVGCGFIAVLFCVTNQSVRAQSSSRTVLSSIQSRADARVAALNQKSVVSAAGNQLSCSDGTANNQCSITKPKFCANGTLIDNPLKCGCPPGQTVQGDSCVPSGSCDSVSTGQTVTVRVTAVDPDADQIYYTLEWGDTKTTRAPQSGMVQSGFTETVTHRYCEAGTFSVIGTAIDSHGNISVASDPLVLCVSGASIPSCDNPKKGDLTCDGRVDVRDLGVLFHFWGRDTASVSDCGISLTSLGVTSALDTIVGDNDFAVLLSSWD